MGKCCASHPVFLCELVYRPRGSSVAGPARAAVQHHLGRQGQVVVPARLLLKIVNFIHRNYLFGK